MQITGLRVDSTSLQQRTWHTPSAPPNRDGAVRESSARRKPSKKGRRGPRRPPPSEALIERPFRSSRSCLPAHSEPPLPRAPLEVARLAPADWHHAETLRELFLPFRGAVARGDSVAEFILKILSSRSGKTRTGSLEHSGPVWQSER